MLNEFKEFIARGNVMDLAVGVIIGASFQRIVDSMVNDLIMPIVGLILGGTDFSNMFLVLSAAVFAYGAFITQVVQFLILAWVVFLLVKAVNRMRRLPAPQ
jgi:large conductance mechanosensitive channel